MSLLTALNTPTVVSRKGDRTTGSPLLDSFVLTPSKISTAYLSQGLAQITAADRASTPDSSLRINLGSLSAALASASYQRKLPEVRRPVEAPPTPSDDLENVLPQVTTTAETDTIAAKTAASDALRKGLSSIVSKPTVKQFRKRLPNPSLERAAAVGMLDLSDKLLFGGEDDALMSAYLGEADPLTMGGDETVVLKYLSQQIAESTLTKIKSRLPLSVQPQPEIEPSQVVLDARNFKVVEAVVLAADRSELQADGGKARAKAEDGAEKLKEQLLDMDSVSQQIAHLNQKVESLSRELLSLATASRSAQPGADEVA